MGYTSRRRSILTAAETVVTVVFLAAIYMLMIEIPIALYLVSPERTTRWLDSGNRLLSRYGRTIVILIAFAFGTYLIIAGGTRLTG